MKLNETMTQEVWHQSQAILTHKWDEYFCILNVFYNQDLVPDRYGEECNLEEVGLHAATDQVEEDRREYYLGSCCHNPRRRDMCGRKSVEGFQSDACISQAGLVQQEAGGTRHSGLEGVEREGGRDNHNP